MQMYEGSERGVNRFVASAICSAALQSTRDLSNRCTSNLAILATKTLANDPIKDKTALHKQPWLSNKQPVLGSATLKLLVCQASDRQNSV
jgi:hypothetical protein